LNSLNIREQLFPFRILSITNDKPILKVILKGQRTFQQLLAAKRKGPSRSKIKEEEMIVRDEYEE